MFGINRRDAQDRQRLKFSTAIKLRKKHIVVLKGDFLFFFAGGARYMQNVKEQCAERLWRYGVPKGEGSWSFLFLEQLLLDML